LSNITMFMDSVNDIIESMSLADITRHIKTCRILLKESPEDADYFGERIRRLEVAQHFKETFDLNGQPTITRDLKTEALAKQVNSLQGKLSYLLKKRQRRVLPQHIKGRQKFIETD